jgi:hypothetical protein
MNFLERFRPAAGQPAYSLQQQIERTEQKIAQLQKDLIILKQLMPSQAHASAALPDGWQIIMDGNTKYYYQKKTGKLQQHIPTLPPPPPAPKPILSPAWEEFKVGNTTWYRHKYTGDLTLVFPEASASEIKETERKYKQWLNDDRPQYAGGKRKQSKRNNK